MLVYRYEFAFAGVSCSDGVQRDWGERWQCDADGAWFSRFEGQEWLNCYCDGVADTGGAAGSTTVSGGCEGSRALDGYYRANLDFKGRECELWQPEGYSFVAGAGDGTQ